MLILIIAAIFIVYWWLNWLDERPSHREYGESNQEPTARQRKKFQIVHEILGLNRLLTFLESKKSQEDSQNEKTYVTQERTLKWVKRYALLTALITVGTIYQGLEARKTLEDSQRPWVVAESAELSEALPGDPIGIGPLIKFKIRNYGNSVATDGRMYASYEPNDTVWLSANWRRSCKDADIARQADVEGKQMTGLGGWPIGFVLAPGDRTAERVGATPVINDADIQAIKERGNSAQGYYIIVCMEYLDQFNKLHTTTTCFDTSGEGLDSSNGEGFTKCNAFQTAN